MQNKNKKYFCYSYFSANAIIFFFFGKKVKTPIIKVYQDVNNLHIKKKNHKNISYTNFNREHDLHLFYCEKAFIKHNFISNQLK